MAYTNITIPALPDYDAETYGKCVIVFNYELDATDWYMVHLIYGAWQFSHTEAQGITNTGTTFTRTYSGGSWSAETQDLVAPSLTPGAHGAVYQRIWTNHNIYDENGDIYLEENTVTPLDEEPDEEDTWLRDFQIGLALGLSGKGYVKRSAEPVAFLYNGVRLPDIYTVYTPEVQTEKPHVFIVEYEMTIFGNHYRQATLYAIPKVEHSKADNGNWCVSTANGCKAWKIHVSLTGDASANDYVGKEWEAIEDTSSFFGIVTSEIDWANFDVLNEDGTLCLAASEPIPIYE